MTYQFLRLEVYGFTSPSNKRNERYGIDQVLGEAGRLPGHIPHLLKPPDVRNLFGESFAELRQRLLNIYVSAFDRSGRPLRNTAALLVSGVASFPYAWGDMLDRADLVTLHAQWQAETLAWLREFHQDSLRKVVEHRDEPFPHVHYFVVPDPAPDGFFTLALPRVHPGRHEKRLVMERGGSNQESNIFYRMGMRKMLDAYFQDVAIRFGFGRKSLTPTRRFTRGQVRLGLHTATRYRKSQEALFDRGGGQLSGDPPEELPGSCEADRDLNL